MRKEITWEWKGRRHFSHILKKQICSPISWLFWVLKSCHTEKKKSWVTWVFISAQLNKSKHMVHMVLYNSHRKYNFSLLFSRQNTRCSTRSSHLTIFLIFSLPMTQCFVDWRRYMPATMPLWKPAMFVKTTTFPVASLTARPGMMYLVEWKILIISIPIVLKSPWSSLAVNTPKPSNCKKNGNWTKVWFIIR